MPDLKRRLLLASAGVALAAPALVTPARAATHGGPPIVLVNGAWLGAWAWDRVMPLLAEAGQSVSAVELSGLGANAHREDPEIGLHVHGRDVTNHLFYHDLRDAIVVGHSYGGCVLSQALANDDDGRIGHAVYLDALIPGKNEGLIDFVPQEAQDVFVRAARARAMLPPRPPETWEALWGLTGEAAEFAEPRMHRVSARCFTERVQGTPFSGKARLSYIRCTATQNAMFDRFGKAAQAEERFSYSEIDGPHHVMLTDPAAMRDGLLAAL